MVDDFHGRWAVCSFYAHLQANGIIMKDDFPAKLDKFCSTIEKTFPISGVIFQPTT
jgi:hypothetical protein